MDGDLAANRYHRIRYTPDGTIQRQQVEQFGDRRDLVGFVIQLASTKIRDINPPFGTARDREQGQQQYLIEWISTFPAWHWSSGSEECSGKSISSQHAGIVISIIDRDSSNHI
ncbi:MAG TPA: hypothetical protein QGG18_01465 [Rhodospirillales bacterium]|nr:hypothetical protein [Rhodospirillales bacterium]